ncbi:MAG TPA: glutamine synthetase family protein [Solirubrobacteraceae bacterium]|nr:glutamine synthetase family protein [Solirubrobacteraceae bacterium]
MATMQRATVPPLDADTGFIAEHGLWGDAQREAAGVALETIERQGLKRVRIGWGDQHGIIRGKTLSIPEFRRSLREGKDFQLVTTIFDTTNHPIVPPFAAGNFAGAPELTGLPDGVLVPDPTTFRALPWVPDTGWVLADAFFTNGRAVPFSTREVYRRQLERLGALGYGYTAGLEIEFYVMRLEDPMLGTEHCGWPPTPPRVSGLSHGFQYLTESRGDEIHELLSTIEDHVHALGLPLLTVEDEWGPGQIEFTFGPQQGLAPADDALLFRTAVKQICRRLGYHATFMARPAFPEFFSTGWHVHQSLSALQHGGANAFAATEPGARLSPVGMQWIAGLLEHAAAGSVFTTPTVTGYKRYRPDSFAPDRVAWALENRGALLRVIGEPGSASAHVENRVGDPAANPYLYLASQVAAGVDGLERALVPPPAVEEPYSADRPPLPRSLIEAVDLLDRDTFFREAFGAPFVDYMLRIKRYELDRFLSHVTDWEQTEYFEMY